MTSLPTPENSGRGRTILVVDDNEDIREIASVILEDVGFKVLCAEGGIEALQLYTQHSDRIQLVLLDLTMPGMGGAETFSKLRAADPDIRILLSSGYSKDVSIDQIDSAGTTGFLQKPYTVDDLTRAILRALE